MMPVTGRYLGSYVPQPVTSLDLANLLDTSGNGHHLTLGGSSTPSFAADPFGIGADAMNFDGDVMAAGVGVPWQTPVSAFTYQFRFTRDTGRLGTVQGLFGRWYRRSGTTFFQFLCYFDSSNNLNFILSGNPSAGATSTVSVGAITDGAPHAAMFVLGGGILYAYLDGVLIQSGTSVTPYNETHAVPMIFGTYDDTNNPAGGNGFHGTLGDFMLSNVARHTGSSYTVPGTPAAADANTLGLVALSGAVGNYLETPAYQGHALVRGAHSQASGGWANPDGPLLQLGGGGYYFTVSGFNGSQWTVWSVKAATLSALLSGAGTLGAAAIQTPSTGEGDLAGNGSVVPFKGEYWHFYHDAGTPSVRYSKGSDLGAPFSPQPGTVLFSGYFDPFVRVSDDGNTLTMYMGAGSTSQRTWYVTTSTNGTSWSTPTAIIGDMSQGGYGGAPGEFSITGFSGAQQFGFSDGAPGSTRDVIGWGTQDGTYWLPLFKRLAPDGTGSDAGSHAYTAVYDSSPFWDSGNSRLVMLTTHSTNSNPTQPTDSDIAVWFIDIAG